MVFASRLLGMALACLSILSFEILSAQLLGVVLQPMFIIFAIAIAMLGMGAAASVASLSNHGRPRWVGERNAENLLWLLAFSYPLVLYLITALSDANNVIFNEAIADGGESRLYITIYSRIFSDMALVGALLFVPYFLFGAWITLFFRALPAHDYHRFYAADLIGAAAGCILSIVVLDSLGYQGAVSTLIGAAVLAGTIFSIGAPAPRTAALALAGVAVVAVTVAPGTARLFEPEPAIDQAGRNYDLSKRVVETWSRWTPLSRVAQLDLMDREEGHRVGRAYSHGAGRGWVTFTERTGLEASGKELARLVTALEPKRVLVLFAGVGHDMLKIDSLCGGRCEITGVEVNRHMIEHAREVGSAELRAFLDRPGIELVDAEAREFLARDTTRYDAILLSWWGAERSQYVGTTGGLSSYLYTVEAFRLLMDHLTPEGIFVTYNASKAQTILTLREALEIEGHQSVRDKILMVGEPGGPARRSFYYDLLEQLRFVVKPSGLSEADLDAFDRALEGMALAPVLSSRVAHPRWDVHRQLAEGAPADRINASLAEQRIELRPLRDDRPFPTNFIPQRHLTDPLRLFSEARTLPEMEYRGAVGLVIAFALASAVLILGPLALRRGPERNPRNAARLAYFACIGGGFMLIEVGLIRKLGLLLGHPSYAIAVVLAALILSTGIGAMLFERLTWRRKVSEKLIAGAVVGTTVLLFLGYERWFDQLIALPLSAKIAIVMAALLPLGLVMGQLFPYGLRVAGSEDPRLVPWAWAINATTSTVAVGVGYLVSFVFGFTVLLVLGAALYALILALPRLLPAPDPAMVLAGS